MSKGLKILSNISGITENSIKDIWEEVKTNCKLLDSCKRPHTFSPLPKSERTSAYAVVGSKCKGKTSMSNMSWYNKGLEDGIKTNKIVERRK